MQGVPASVVTATSMFSASIRWAIWTALLRSLCSWQLVSGVEMSKAFSSFMVTRVSSAAINCTLRRVSMARGLMSLRLPIGVATTYSVGIPYSPSSPFFSKMRSLALRARTFSCTSRFDGFTPPPPSACLYEAARIDGANRWKQILHVTIPGLLPTFILLLIMQIGQLLNCVFDKIYLLQNTLNLQVSEMLPTYVYKTGMISQKYGLATAGGLFNSVISVVLVLIANTISRKVSETSLF